LKVNLCTTSIEDMAKLVEGLKILNKCDPSIIVYAMQTGDLVVGTCGQVHLERCVTDLQQMYNIKIKISEPIVSFRETIVYDKLKKLNNKPGHKYQ